MLLVIRHTGDEAGSGAFALLSASADIVVAGSSMIVVGDAPMDGGADVSSMNDVGLCNKSWQWCLCITVSFVGHGAAASMTDCGRAPMDGRAAACFR
uniref:Uncharacterized protein n=1 Tax=Panagrolaimus superbus TaxID=310955 RepID=A0A914Y4E2_9BILA